MRGRTSLAVGRDGVPLVVFAAGPAGATQPARLQALHCVDVACTTGQARVLVPILIGQVDLDTAVTIGSDGRPLIAYVPADSFPAPPSLALLQCMDPACATASPETPPASPEPTLIGSGRVRSPSLVTAPDGLPRLAYGRAFDAPLVIAHDTVFLRCIDAACASSERESFFAFEAYPSLAMPPNGLPMIAWGRSDRLLLATCTDPQCRGFSATCAPVERARPSLALGTDSSALAAMYAPTTGDLVVAHGIDGPCGNPTLSIVAEIIVPEGDSGTTQFTALFDPLTGPPAAWPTADYATLDGSATAGDDYRAAAGSLTFMPGPPPFMFPIPYPTPLFLAVNGDTVDEPDETFDVQLANPMNVVLGNSTLRVIIRDDDPGQLSAGDCAVVEGASGPIACVVEVRLGAPSPLPVTVDFATAGGTATAGADFLASSGTLTFDPGSLVREVTVSVLGDVSVELDETFFVHLSNPLNATILDGAGLGTIVDDDAGSLSTLELTHGGRVAADLASAPGPLAEPDLYRLFQPAYSSWEIVVDGVSGDVAPGLLVERLAEDNSYGPADRGRCRHRFGTGAALAAPHRDTRGAATHPGRQHVLHDRLRPRRHVPAARLRHHGPHPALQQLEQPGHDPGPAERDRTSHRGGRRLLERERRSAAHGTAVPRPRAVAIVNTAAVGALAGASGSITVTSDGPYGGIVGKSVALEPATGFSFDSPLAVKPR